MRAANANHAAEFGVPVIWCAAHNGRLTVVEALLDAGAVERGNALCGAARGGHTAAAALLLDRGADVNFGNDSPLAGAARTGRLETATLLLQRGATARNEFLTIAVERGHHAVADLLRAHGAV